MYRSKICHNLLIFYLKYHHQICPKLYIYYCSLLLHAYMGNKEMFIYVNDYNTHALNNIRDANIAALRRISIYPGCLKHVMHDFFFLLIILILKTILHIGSIDTLWIDPPTSHYLQMYCMFKY